MSTLNELIEKVVLRFREKFFKNSAEILWNEDKSKYPELTYISPKSGKKLEDFLRQVIPSACKEYAKEIQKKNGV